MNTLHFHDNNRSRPRCGFLNLPFELRLRVYEELLATEKPIAITDDRPRPSQIQDIHLQPQLLRVCSQLHNEGADVLYGANTFETLGRTNGYFGRHLSKWLNRIGDGNVARLDHLSLSLLYSPPLRRGTYGLFWVETTIRLRKPQAFAYTAKYQESFEPWVALLEPDSNVEKQLELLFRTMLCLDRAWQARDIVAIYEVAMQIRPKLKEGADMSIVPEGARYFFDTCALR